MTEMKNIVGDIKKKSIEALDSRITETEQEIETFQNENEETTRKKQEEEENSLKRNEHYTRKL